MIHYFNPGHETAILNASKYYQPPVRVVGMQNDLAFLPAWYASPDDFVLTPNGLTDAFRATTEALNPLAQAIVYDDLAKNKEIFQTQEIGLWGISPQSVYLFEKWNKECGFQWNIPEWKTEYHSLTSRLFAQKILSQLIAKIPEIEADIIPCPYSCIEEIENFIFQSKKKQLIKSPYSSSGRGLIWLPPAGKIAQSERQILCGMLKKQGQVSMEKVLDKQLDFSMHFDNQGGQARFIGYSVFQTNSKGAYEKSFLACREKLEKQITSFIDSDLLLRVKNAFLPLLQEMYFPYYTGNIGVDMLIYLSGKEYKLHPCVEINMRKSMGYLAIQLFDNYIHPDFQGEFFIEYNANPQILFQKQKERYKQYPLIIENGRIRNGSLDLCPISESTNYQSFIVQAKSF